MTSKTRPSGLYPVKSHLEGKEYNVCSLCPLPACIDCALVDLLKKYDKLKFIKN